MTGVFIQARLDSSRLAGKVLLPLGNLTVLEQALRRLRRIPAGIYAVLTDAAGIQALGPLARRWGFRLFPGSRDDVLDRFARAILHFGVERVIRATGDNPLVCPELANQTLALSLNSGADYCALQGAPLGTGVEVVRAAALLEAAEEAQNPYEREHVCPFLYRRPERFRLVRPMVDPPWRGDARLTLDTPADYEFLKYLYEKFHREEPIALEEMIPRLRGEHRGAS